MDVVSLQDYTIDATDRHVLIEYEGDDGSNGKFSVYLMPFRPKLRVVDKYHVKVADADLESYAQYKLVYYAALGIDSYDQNQNIPVFFKPLSVTMTR